MYAYATLGDDVTALAIAQYRALLPSCCTPVHWFMNVLLEHEQGLGDAKRVSKVTKHRLSHGGCSLAALAQTISNKSKAAIACMLWQCARRVHPVRPEQAATLQASRGADCMVPCTMLNG